MSGIRTDNHGPLITRTDYWETEYAGGGKIYCSVNAGAIRVLLPPSKYGDLASMRAAQYCVLSRGPWPEVGAPEAVEILFEDHSSAPYAIHLTAQSFDALPDEPLAGREWVVSVWTLKDGRPHKALERACHWRRGQSGRFEGGMRDGILQNRKLPQKSGRTP